MATGPPGPAELYFLPKDAVEMQQGARCLGTNKICIQILFPDFPTPDSTSDKAADASRIQISLRTRVHGFKKPCGCALIAFPQHFNLLRCVSVNSSAGDFPAPPREERAPWDVARVTNRWCNYRATGRLRFPPTTSCTAAPVS
ncbi:hypothetical protein Bbelb_280890 [Branchiostoma belcheri]|nr:hypothetical protein Bbelb_280890 [Branchiostoma belcheri]